MLINSTNSMSLIRITQPDRAATFAQLRRLLSEPPVCDVARDGRCDDNLALIIDGKALGYVFSDPEASQRLLKIARRAGKPVVEDAFEMDLRYDGEPVPPLAALDGHGLVVHLFSLSKSLFPGVRTGAVTARGRAQAPALAPGKSEFATFGQHISCRSSRGFVNSRDRIRDFPEFE